MHANWEAASGGLHCVLPTKHRWFLALNSLAIGPLYVANRNGIRVSFIGLNECDSRPMRDRGLLFSFICQAFKDCCCLKQLMPNLSFIL